MKRDIGLRLGEGVGPGPEDWVYGKFGNQPGGKDIRTGPESADADVWTPPVPP